MEMAENCGCQALMQDLSHSHIAPRRILNNGIRAASGHTAPFRLDAGIVLLFNPAKPVWPPAAGMLLGIGDKLL